jgi:hypothetical protein
LTEIHCPFCGRTKATGKTINERTKVTCGGCGNTFKPIVESIEFDTSCSLPPMAELLELDAQPLPPAKSTPKTLTRRKPPKEKELHGERKMFLQDSRHFVAALLSISLIGLGYYCINWYVYQINKLERMGTKAGERHNQKIEKYSAPSPKHEGKSVGPSASALKQSPFQLEEHKPLAPKGSMAGLYPQAQVRAQEASRQSMTGSLPTPPPLPATPSLPTQEKAPINPADPVEEAKASNKLFQAKQAVKKHMYKAAQTYCQEVIDKFPNTSAVEEATSMLKNLKARQFGE